MKNVKATVATVTPLSQRRKGSKYAAMTIRVDYAGGKDRAKKRFLPDSEIMSRRESHHGLP